MKKAMVSVVIPNWNYEHYLPETIESVIAQTYKNWELIVVDDNSTDSSREIVENYIKKYPQYDIRLFHNKTGPSGTPTPINIGIKNMKGEFFAWLSSDDAFMPEKLEKQVKKMEQNPNLGMVYTRTKKIDETGLSPGANSIRVMKSRKQFFIDLIQENFINGNTVLIRKSLLDTIGPLMETHEISFDVWRAAEYEWWLKMALESTVMAIPEPLHYARIHPENLAYNRSDFGQYLKGLFLSFLFTQYDPFTIAEKLELDEKEMIWIEAFNRKILAEAGYPGVVTARHDFINSREPSREERIGKKSGEISRALFLFKCADFYWKIKRFDQSISFIQQVLKLFPGIPDWKPYYMKASYLKSLEDFDGAVEMFELILENDPVVDSSYRTGAAFHLGEIYHKQGQKEKAKNYFRICLEENPNHGKAVQYLQQLGTPVQKNYWDVGAEQDPVRVIADLKNREEFEISGICDANMILRHVKQDRFENILDIGCGMGRVMKPMSHAARTITGVDTSREMIQQAEIYLKNIPNKKLLWVKEETTPFDSRHFDFVYSIVVFMHIPLSNFKAWIKEASRVLKTSGIFWFQVYADFGPSPTVPQDCSEAGGKVRAYSKAQLKEILGKHFNKVTIIKDPLDRYHGNHWYYVWCESPNPMAWGTY